MENENQDIKICPILSAGAIASANNPNGEVVGCWGDGCELWSEEHDCCALAIILAAIKLEVDDE